ncbi:hypothetical protein KY321_04480 [Candidatus Woesearchaeota archaeon]|nr:hypothetical protein [Candidatus Woesearchaeota archaeon]
MIIDGFEFERNGYRILMSYNFTMDKGESEIYKDGERFFELSLDGTRSRDTYDVTICKKLHILETDTLNF